MVIVFIEEKRNLLKNKDKMSLFIPSYFGPISEYSEIIKSETITFEMEDNFQKHSYRNRCYIYNSNGKQLLNIPVKHKNKGNLNEKKRKIYW